MFMNKIMGRKVNSQNSAPIEADPVDKLFRDGVFDPQNLPQLPVELSFMPDGWMSELELRLLYSLGRDSQGDFLEIGPWIGRSTTAIALGRRDGGAGTRRFDTVDYGFVSLSDFCEALNTGIGYASNDEIARPVLGNGGSIAYLIENLRKRSLLPQITSIIRGNALEAPLRESYSVIFCDAVHSEHEIGLTGPLLAKLARPGSWLVCDDIHVDAKLVAALEEHLQFESLILLGEYDAASKAAFGRVRSTSVHPAVPAR
ncbi:class I SAM-dependent methyltransferase [Brucella tritici]|uniref:class I SAM-dependent methyltransferase n=1 Tax=Brucella tritici TaxID=94626 RepID=UPI00159015A8|nr:class I SAM-dependent methyltransferase [Brucella tritici]